jgi:Ser/Thr protein kinase RdoA (MazF antagonist)
LDVACEQANLSAEHAGLLRLGENAIYLLADERVVVRIARSVDQLPRMRRELCVARWLTAAGVPSVRPYDLGQQPIVASEHPVSFWHAVSGGPTTPDHTDLARLLARFHALDDCPCDLPAFDPLTKVMPRLEAAIGVGDADRDFLAARCRELEVRWRDLEFALPAGPIHGDAWTGNLLVDDDRVVLGDFESAAIGPREWDLLPTAIAQSRYGLSADRYQQFVDAYGFDVTEWSGYLMLREIRELGMTTWLMQMILESADIEAEFRRRVTSLREGDFARAWSTF